MPGSRLMTTRSFGSHDRISYCISTYTTLIDVPRIQRTSPSTSGAAVAVATRAVAPVATVRYSARMSSAASTLPAATRPMTRITATRITVPTTLTDANHPGDILEVPASRHTAAPGSTATARVANRLNQRSDLLKPASVPGMRPSNHLTPCSPYLHPKR